jgi:drug/metabolite transporter (DMT)-like permease
LKNLSDKTPETPLALDSVLIISVEPVLNPILVFIFIGERPGKMALFGGGLVFGAVTVRSILGTRSKDQAMR